MNPISLKIWDASDEEEYDVTYEIENGTGTFNGIITVINSLEIDDGEEQYRGKPRPTSLAEFEIDFPNKSERLDINNIPKEGLPLGEFESNGVKSP